MKNPVVAWMLGIASRLRFPWLLALTVGLLLLDLVIPDLIPFVDEILLGLATLLLGNWKRRRRPDDDDAGPAGGGGSSGRVIDVTPER